MPRDTGNPFNVRHAIDGDAPEALPLRDALRRHAELPSHGGSAVGTATRAALHAQAGEGDLQSITRGHLETHPQTLYLRKE